MPSWGEILLLLQASAAQNQGQPDFDGVRRGFLHRLHEYTGRNVVIYYTDWLRGAGPMSSIDLGDMQGMMEVCQGLEGPSLDIILHSPGGSAEATASIVRYLREKFSDIRVFVPLAAMSAATMWALSANLIVMGKHSQLGPIDPQVITPRGVTPARAILEQFQRAKDEIAANPAALGAWAPIVQQYGPALLEQCEKAEALSVRLVADWLGRYMFAGAPENQEKAEQVARLFSDYDKHQSHSLGISRDQVAAWGVSIAGLEDDQELQDRVLSVHHAALHTLNGANVKIIENHLDKAFVLQQAQVSLPFQLPLLRAPEPITPPVAGAPVAPQPESG